MQTVAPGAEANDEAQEVHEADMADEENVFIGHNMLEVKPG